MQDVLSRLREVLFNEQTSYKVARFSASSVFGVFFLKWLFGMSWNELLNGVSLGSLYGLI
ncbi:MAG: hypothetical protein QOC57_265, partial [Ilumatobacteraceae bacterium]